MLQAELLDDDAIAEPLLLAMALGMTLKHLRSLALLLGQGLGPDRGASAARRRRRNCGCLTSPTSASGRRAFAQRADHCIDDADKLLPKLHRAGRTRHRAARRGGSGIENRPSCAQSRAQIKFSARQARKLGDTGRPRSATTARRSSPKPARSMIGVLDQCLRLLTSWVGSRVLERKRSTRRRDGKLEFHDLLVSRATCCAATAMCAPPCTRTTSGCCSTSSRTPTRSRSSSPTRICGGADASTRRLARTSPCRPGRLFVVGDSKQSIYRFRRASIATYLDAEQHIGEPVELTTNFRTVEPILDWVNAVFGETDHLYLDGAQPGYVPLGLRPPEHRPRGRRSRCSAPTPHEDKPNAAAPARARGGRCRRGRSARPSTSGGRCTTRSRRRGATRAPDDIAVLVPARTSLPFLEDALDAAQIPYRAEASSLVYQADEVRSLLACARAVADTSDELVAGHRAALAAVRLRRRRPVAVEAGRRTVRASTPNWTSPTRWRPGRSAPRWPTCGSCATGALADRRARCSARSSPTGGCSRSQPPGRGRAMRGAACGSSSTRRGRGRRCRTAGCGPTWRGRRSRARR